MFQPAAKAGFGAALNGKAVQLAQLFRGHPFGGNAFAVFGIKSYVVQLPSSFNRCSQRSCFLSFIRMTQLR